MRDDKVVLVERPAVGNDYRVVVLDGEVISAYHRIPLTVVGTGTATLSELIDEVQVRFRHDGREETINKDDFRIRRTLQAGGYHLGSILARGQRLKLLDNANLSSGGTSVDVTDKISTSFEKLVRDISRDMGLRLVGVDLMIDGTLAGDPEMTTHWVIEINSAPGLDHYASLGIAQQKIVDDLYCRIVEAMERADERIV